MVLISLVNYVNVLGIGYMELVIFVKFNLVFVVLFIVMIVFIFFVGFFMGFFKWCILFFEVDDDNFFI